MIILLYPQHFSCLTQCFCMFICGYGHESGQKESLDYCRLLLVHRRVQGVTLGSSMLRKKMNKWILGLVAPVMDLMSLHPYNIVV